jgi:hypothetical protein
MSHQYKLSREEILPRESQLDEFHGKLVNDRWSSKYGPKLSNAPVVIGFEHMIRPLDVPKTGVSVQYSFNFWSRNYYFSIHLKFPFLFSFLCKVKTLIRVRHHITDFISAYTFERPWLD